MRGLTVLHDGHQPYIHSEIALRCCLTVLDPEIDSVYTRTDPDRSTPTLGYRIIGGMEIDGKVGKCFKINNWRRAGTNGGFGIWKTWILGETAKKD